MKLFEVFEDYEKAKAFANRVEGMVYEVKQAEKTYYKVTYYAD